MTEKPSRKDLIHDKGFRGHRVKNSSTQYRVPSTWSCWTELCMPIVDETDRGSISTGVLATWPDHDIPRTKPPSFTSTYTLDSIIAYGSMN